MTAVAAQSPPDPAEILALRIWARAYLWSIGEFANLPEAVDPRWDYAEQSGLVDLIGVDAVQAMLAGQAP